MNDDVRNVLRIAKGRISESWGQGEGCCPPFVGDCTITAIDRSSDRSDEAHRVAVVAKQYLRAELGVGCLVGWNDTPGRTQAEVVALFDRVLAADLPLPDDTAIEAHFREEVLA